MNRKKRAKDHERNTDKYLKDTQHTYFVNLQSGLYQPHSQETQDATTVEIASDIERIKPQGSWADWISAGTGVFGIFLSIATLIGLTLTVFFTQRQWREANRNADAAEISAISAQQSVVKSQTAIDQSRDQFLKDERPYVALTPLISHFSIMPAGTSDAGKMAMNFHYRNFGKSPAIHVMEKSYISLDMNNSQDDIRWKHIKHVGESILVPGQEGWQTAYSSEVASLEAIAAMEITPNPVKPNIVIHVQITYSDQSGRIYETEACLEHRNTGAVGLCVEHNALK